jgi:hypothetical protein
LLDPHDRSLFLESLRPPEGYTLDHAVGTTFTLDLLALLTAPLAFTFYGWEPEDGRAGPAPLALLHAIRQYADRIHVFCQAGQIAVPSEARLLYTYLENSVIEVKSPRPGGVFHPKLWILRYVAPDQPMRYRLLCMSRNLTFDRSWDTILVLDGRLEDRQRGFGVNQPLADLVATLPGLALRRPPDQPLAVIEQMQRELRRVRWQLPDGFDQLSFWPLGMRGSGRARSWPFDGGSDRVLVVSPFLSAGCLQRIESRSVGSVLVSRTESLDEVGQARLTSYDRVFVLNDSASIEQASDAADLRPDAPTASELYPPLFGLHAKLYIADDGSDARVWTGSANATDAAYTRNVEFMVELRGQKSRVGIDAVLREVKGGTSFRDLLEEYQPALEPIRPEPERDSAQRDLEKARLALAGAGMRATVTATDVPSEFALRLAYPTSDRRRLPRGVAARCWPVTLAEQARGVELDMGAREPADFGRVSLEAITSFFAFQLALPNCGRGMPVRFVLNLPVDGAPADRQEAIMRSILKDRNRVMRFLLMLLAEDDLDSVELLLMGDRAADSGGNDTVSLFGVPLFESLVRALDRDPARIDQVKSVVDELLKTDEGRELLPEGFEAIWEPVWIARERLPHDA